MADQYHVDLVNKGPLKVLNDAFVALQTLFNKLNELIKKHNLLSQKTFSFDDLTSHPTTLGGYGITDAAPLHHTHPISDVIGLQAELDHLQSEIDTGPGAVHWADILGKPSTFPPPLTFYDSRFYQQSQVNALLTGYLPVGTNFDSRYYTKPIVDTLLSGKVSRIGDYMDGFVMQPLTESQDLVVPADHIMRVVGPFDVSGSIDVEGILEVVD